MEDFRNRPLSVIPSPQDIRDYHITTVTPVRTEVPEEFTVEHLPNMYDQGAFGMCVAFALAAIKESQEHKERSVQTRYSPVFIYGNRAKDDYQGEGMIPREALRALYRHGVVDYSKLPGLGYYPNCKEMVEKLNYNVFSTAVEQKISTYMRLNTAQEVKTALIDLGPVLITTAVYDSFYNTPRNGIVPDIKSGESIVGYHAMTIVGYRKINNRDYYIVHNSWGERFGEGGKCYIPTDYKGISELWSVADYIRPVTTEEIIMNAKMQILDPGHTMLPFRAIYEALGASVDWGRTNTGKIWARAVVPPVGTSVTIYTEQDSAIMKVTS